MAFDSSVFVNCPFDDEHRPILVPLLFTIHCLGFEPRLALESCDSGAPRIDKLISLKLRAARLSKNLGPVRELRDADTPATLE